jgi:hypothetical protein
MLNSVAKWLNNESIYDDLKNLAPEFLDLLNKVLYFIAEWFKFDSHYRYKVN